MNVEKLEIPDLFTISPICFKDERGFFFEAFNKRDFDKLLGRSINFVQDNHSVSNFGVLRGLHFQKPPYAQGKLIRVIKGEIYDVAVDLRINSKNYGQWVGVTLSDKNKKQLWIPEGFAHGFIAMSSNVEIVYKTTNYYHPDSECILKWNDEILNINWPNIKKIISSRDQEGVNFSDLEADIFQFYND